MAGELDVGQLVSTARLNAGQYFETLDRMVAQAEEARGKIEELQFGAGAQGMREATEAARAETEALSGLSEAEREAASAGKEGAEAAREQAAADREGATAGRENAEALTADTEAEREAATAAREQAAATREAAEAGQAGAESAREQSTAEREAATAERELASAGREGATAERELGSAEKEAASAAREGSEAEREAAAAGREMGSAEKEAASAAREGASAGREAASADRELSAAETEVVSQTDALSAGQRTLREAIMAAASSEDEAVAGLRAIGTSTEEATSAYRDFQEAQRSAADSAREEAGAERDAAEGTRAESEAAREGAGAAREQAEAQRTAGESARTLGEGERGAGAAERESATAARENATAVREEGSAQGVAATAAGEHKNVLRDIAFAFFDIQIAAGVVKGILDTIWNNSIGPAKDYEQELQRVQANTFLTDTTTQALSKTVLEMASRAPAKIEDLVQAERHLNDMGFNANDSQKILEATMKVSVATGADLEKTTNLVAFAMHDYKLSGDQALATVAMLNNANKEGNTTFEQMRSALQRPIPFAQALGVSLTDVATAEATMSRNGLTVGNTASALTNIFSHMITPSRGVEEELQKLTDLTGIDLVHAVSEAGIKEDGFSGVIKKVHDAIQGHNEELVKLQPNLRGTIGLITLAGDGYEEYNRLLKQNNDAEEQAKDLANDYQKALSTQASQTQILQNNTQELRIEIGNMLLPAMKELTGGAIDVVKGWVDWGNHHQELVRDIGNFVEGVGKALGFLLKELALQHFPLLRRSIDENVKSLGEFSVKLGQFLENISGSGAEKVLSIFIPGLDKMAGAVHKAGEEMVSFGNDAIVASKGNDTWKGSIDNLTEHLSSGTRHFQQASETAKDYGETTEGLTAKTQNLAKAQDLLVESQVQAIKGHEKVAELLKQEADAYKANDEPQAKYLAGQVKIQQARDDAAKTSDTSAKANEREATSVEKLQGRIDDLGRSIKITTGQLAEMETESPKTEDAQARLAERIRDTGIKLDGLKEQLGNAQAEMSRLTGVSDPAGVSLGKVGTAGERSAEGITAAGDASKKASVDLDLLSTKAGGLQQASIDSEKRLSEFQSRLQELTPQLTQSDVELGRTADALGQISSGPAAEAPRAIFNLYRAAREDSLQPLIDSATALGKELGIELPKQIFVATQGAASIGHPFRDAGQGVDYLQQVLTSLSQHITSVDDPALRTQLTTAITAAKTAYNNLVSNGLEPAVTAFSMLPQEVSSGNEALTRSGTVAQTAGQSYKTLGENAGVSLKALEGFQPEAQKLAGTMSETEAKTTLLAASLGKDLPPAASESAQKLAALYTTTHDAGIKDLLGQVQGLAQEMGVQLPVSLDTSGKSFTKATDGVGDFKNALQILSFHVNDLDPVLRVRFASTIQGLQQAFNDLVNNGLEPCDEEIGVLPSKADPAASSLEHLSAKVKVAGTDSGAAAGDIKSVGTAIDSLASSLKSEFTPNSDAAKFSLTGFHTEIGTAKQKINDLMGQIAQAASSGDKGSLSNLQFQLNQAQGALHDLEQQSRQSGMSDLLEATGKVADAMGVELPNSIKNGAQKSLGDAGGGVDTLKNNLTLLASHINDTDDPALRTQLSGALSTVQTGFNNMVKEGLEPASSALNVDIPKGVDATNTKLGNHISGFVKPMEVGWQAAGTATEQTGKTMTEKIPPAVNTVNESLKTHRNEGLIPTETEYGNLATAGTTAINTLAMNVNKGLDELKTSASEKAKAVGEGIDQGLAGGIGELSGIVIAAGEKVISDMIAAMKARSREGSPSQEGADIGKNMDAGVVQGLEGGEGGVNGAGTKVAGAAVTGLGSQTEGANSAGADLSAAAVTGFNSNDGAAHEAGISMGAAFASGLAQELNSVGGTAGHDLVQIAKSGGLSARALAGGGEITEEIWGVGVQSGQAYHLGEAGNEWVIPESGASELPGIPQGPAPMVNVTLPPAPPDPAKGKVTIPLNIYMDKKKVASAVFADVDENSVLEVTIQ